MEKGTAQYRRSKKPLLKSCYSVYAINCAKGGVPRRGNDWVKHILGEAQTSKVYGSSTAVRKGGLRPPIPPVLRQKAAELPPCRRRRRHACSSLFGESRATRVHGVMTLRVGVHQRVATRGGGDSSRGRFDICRSSILSRSFLRDWNNRTCEEITPRAHLKGIHVGLR